MTDQTALPAVPLRVAELLCSRLCHDLISPTAALSNGLELLAEDSDGMAGEITQLLSFSAGQAAGWLMFYRVAYGLGGDSADALTLSDAAALIRGIVEADKIALDLAEGDAALGRGATKALLNAALVGLETLPNRGHLSLALENGDGVRISVVAEGDGVALRPEVRAALSDGAAVGDLTARTVQGWFTAWLASARGGSFGIATETPTRIEFTAELPKAG